MTEFFEIHHSWLRACDAMMTRDKLNAFIKSLQALIKYSSGPAYSKARFPPSVFRRHMRYSGKNPGFAVRSSAQHTLQVQSRVLKVALSLQSQLHASQSNPENAKHISSVRLAEQLYSYWSKTPLSELQPGKLIDSREHRKVIWRRLSITDSHRVAAGAIFEAHPELFAPVKAIKSEMEQDLRVATAAAAHEAKASLKRKIIATGRLTPAELNLLEKYL